MREYDLFIPLRYNDGAPIEAEKLIHVRKRLVEHFGGLTNFRQSNEGFWRVGNVTFRDEIVIYRVLACKVKAAKRFLEQLKEELIVELRQEDVLIVGRKVRVL